MQVDVLMTVQAAERLKNWLDQYIRNLKARAGSGRQEPCKRRMAPIPIEGDRVAAAQ